MLLIAGLLLFLGIHVIPSTPVKAVMMQQWGENLYKLGFSLVALIGFGLIIYGKSIFPQISIFSPPLWLRVTPKLLMLPASILLFAPYFPNHVRSHLKDPMMLGVMLWGGSHLLINGDLGSLLLFGSFFLSSLSFLLHSFWKTAKNRPHKSSSFWGSVILIVISVSSYILIWNFHGVLFGRPL